MNDERLITLIADVLALSRHLMALNHQRFGYWPFVEAMDSEGALFSIRWTPPYRDGAYETVVVGPKSGLVFVSGMSEDKRSIQLVGRQAFDILTEMRTKFECVALDAEMRLMETQAQRERTEQARKNVYEKLALSAPRGYR